MLPLEHITVGQLLERTARTYPKNLAIRCGATDWSYAHLLRQARAAGRRFLALGVKKGEHVALWGELEPELLGAYYGLQLIGAVAVMVNTSLGKRELSDLLALSDSAYLLVGDSYKCAGDMGEIGRELGDEMALKGVYGVGRSASAALPAFSALEKAPPKAVDAAAAAVTPEDTAVILFTSGSTSVPKAVASSHFSRVNGGIQQADDLQVTQADRFLVATPMFHCFCISANLMAALAVGGCLCVPKSRRVAAINEAVERWRCTVFHSVPTLYHAILAKPDFDPARYASLRIGIIGGAYYPPETFLEYEEKLGLKLMSSLGQTETTAGLSICSLDDSPAVRSTTVGHFMHHVKGKIVCPQTGKPLPTGQVGEICVKGYLNMQGYYKQPELTAATIDAEGFVHTGDLGALDAAGNITLHGRLKELIIRNGENISPVEIETALGKLDAIDVCKVVGLPDAHSGEVVCACIRLRPGKSLTEEAVKAHLREMLAEYKVPEFVVFLPEFPLSSTGKILGKETARLAQNLLGR